MSMYIRRQRRGRSAVGAITYHDGTLISCFMEGAWQLGLRLLGSARMERIALADGYCSVEVSFAVLGRDEGKVLVIVYLIYEDVLIRVRSLDCNEFCLFVKCQLDRIVVNHIVPKCCWWWKNVGLSSSAIWGLLVLGCGQC